MIGIVAEQFDIVVAGAGHNSLLAAAYLAKAGFRCMVLEGRPIPGGGVKSAELTLRGFIHDVCSSAHNGIYGNPALKKMKLLKNVRVLITSITDIEYQEILRMAGIVATPGIPLP